MNLTKNKQKFYFFSFISVSFVIGYLFGNTYQTLPLKNIGNLNSSNSFSKTLENDQNLKLFNEAYNIISKNYYSFNNISQKDMIYGMINGLISSLKDKHSEFFNIEETKKFNEVLSGDFEGIGAVIQKNDFGVSIDRIIAGSPAKDAGLLSGDIIIKANDISLKDLSVNDAVNKIRGPAGTKVKLEILRQGEKEILIKEVTRRKINIPSVDSKILDGSIGYIVISIFGEKSGNEFKKNLENLYSKDVKGIILDLRDNGGGFLNTAVDILSNFIDKDKVIVTTKEKNPLNNKSYFSYGNDFKKIPIVVLINGNSASASEITAGALKDYNIAILVGEKSYGKGSVQEPFVLSDGSEMKITVAKWYTPLDHGIDGSGIKPDFVVTFNKEDYTNMFDRQLDEAKNILLKFIELGDIKKTKDFFNIKKQLDLKKKLEGISTGSGNLDK